MSFFIVSQHSAEHGSLFIAARTHAAHTYSVFMIASKRISVDILICYATAKTIKIDKSKTTEWLFLLFLSSFVFYSIYLLPLSADRSYTDIIRYNLCTKFFTSPKIELCFMCKRMRALDKIHSNSPKPIHRIVFHYPSIVDVASHWRTMKLFYSRI